MHVLIVDDESFVRRSLLELLESEDSPSSKVSSAENGIEAVRILQEHAVDLVISDIRMPGMDGLELARHIHEGYPDTETVLLTGYQDFTYARQAIRYGVREYLVKPNSVESILGVVSATSERLQLKKQQEQLQLLRNKHLQKKLLSDLLYGLPLPFFETNLLPSFHSLVVVTISLRGNALPQSWSEQAMYSAAINILEELFNQHTYTVGIQDEQEAIFLLFYAQESEDLENMNEALALKGLEKLKNLLKYSFGAGISKFHRTLEEIAPAYRESLEALRQVKKENASPDISRSDGSRSSSSAQLEEQLQVKAKRRIISLMTEAMRSRLQENLTLKMIADELYMNPTYLGRIFKEDMGECFSSFLTRLRIQKATELLEDVTLKVYEVSDLVGFRDPAYFSLIFKKTMGVTPQDYQKHNK
ncbi:MULTISPECIES: response regulator [Paenibacillus]|uniref:DNA-binding response regulator n=1 Tax=Paenibacillus borealis TaxID=160799 RepID=A0ABX3HTA4_PAEBO|nr:response regulator [Paenibacillus borealis]OMD53643.1 hypothetical protein BSK56_00405 [Paenibacillus borealis]